MHQACQGISSVHNHLLMLHMSADPQVLVLLRVLVRVRRRLPGVQPGSASPRCCQGPGAAERHSLLEQIRVQVIAHAAHACCVPTFLYCCGCLSVCAGGFLACNLAARHPDAVKGLVLLNATPFWSSRPPAGKEGLLWKLLPSTVPVPKVRCMFHATNGLYGCGCCDLG
jgi:hypothetical protein